MNVAYMCYYLTNNVSKCLDVLIKSKRFSEAALFARTYSSERVSECVKLWRDSLVDKTLAQKISDPNEEGEEEG
jgi:coatomer subunit beta'